MSGGGNKELSTIVWPTPLRFALCADGNDGMEGSYLNLLYDDWGYDERKYASRRAVETPVCGFVLRIIADWCGQLRGLYSCRDSGFIPQSVRTAVEQPAGNAGDSVCLVAVFQNKLA